MLERKQRVRTHVQYYVLALIAGCVPGLFLLVNLELASAPGTVIAIGFGGLLSSFGAGLIGRLLLTASEPRLLATVFAWPTCTLGVLTVIDTVYWLAYGIVMLAAALLGSCAADWLKRRPTSS
ncbi:MAG: hypothetical protein IT430_20255 [Phycisphaerales bacterium]|nr:hypothetical protein [Phycisphaerales bacterium]